MQRKHVLLTVLLVQLANCFTAVAGGIVVSDGDGDYEDNSDRQFHAGYSRTTSGSGGTTHTAGAFGQYENGKNMQTEQQLLYATAADEHHSLGSNYKAEVGVHRASGSVHNIDAGVFTHGKRGSTYETKFLSVGAESGVGTFMGRAALADATVNVGHIGINAGVTADTGVKFKDGIEAKFLGIGGKVGKDGIQACFVICFGINW